MDSKFQSIRKMMRPVFADFKLELDGRKIKSSKVQ